MLTRTVVPAVLVTAFVGVLALIGIADWRRGTEAATLEAEWLQTKVERVAAFGATQRLEILPLVNWHATSDALQTEPGVSYLVRTDDQTILFDVGFNRDGTDPSPLEHNMRELGIELAEIDSVFISHAHRDHVGGTERERARTFSLGVKQADLSGKDLFAPVPMTYPGAEVSHVTQPLSFGKAVASTGPIPRRLFMGHIDEQALVINLAGKGLVVVVGCGHQTLPKLLSRLEEAFAEPVYAIIGDLHYPVPEGRVQIAGLDAQRRFASGDGFFEPLSQQVVDNELRILEQRLGFLALGGHDTSDEVLAALEKTLEERFQRAKVGSLISLHGAP
ncbi:MAG: MBL fold metallo-hydrolase [bacterium]|nr:MBL fold metallo-hydrolase [bacterium]